MVSKNKPGSSFFGIITKFLKVSYILQNQTQSFMLWTIFGSLFTQENLLRCYNPQETECHLLAHLLTADKSVPWRVVSGPIQRDFHNQWVPVITFTWIAKDQLQFPWHTEWLDIYCCTKFLQSPLLLLTASCFLAAPRYTKCCFVSHFLTFFIQSLSGQFLPWIVVFPESFCATTLYSPQYFVECILIPSRIKYSFLIKSLHLPSKAKSCEALALSTGFAPLCYSY